MAFPKLYRSLGSGTGVSLREGEPVKAVADLPEHKIEIHRFNSSDAAGAFIAGIELAGPKNVVGWTWEPGTSERNRHVIVARFDEARPDVDELGDAIVVVEHDSRNLDGVAFKQSMEAIYARRDEDQRRDRERMAPLRAAVEAEGLKINETALNWLRVGPSGVTIVFEADGYRLSDQISRQAFADQVDYQSIATAAGLDLDDGGYDWACGPFDQPEAAAAAVARFDEANARLAAEIERLTQETFEARMRPTTARRRFLAEANALGVAVGYHRGSRYGRAGRLEVKASELADMIRIGWLDLDGTRASVTDKGRIAAGIEPALAPMR